jgi:hypothetical protein
MDVTVFQIGFVLLCGLLALLLGIACAVVWAIVLWERHLERRALRIRAADLARHRITPDFRLPG